MVSWDYRIILALWSSLYPWIRRWRRTAARLESQVLLSVWRTSERHVHHSSLVVQLTRSLLIGNLPADYVVNVSFSEFFGPFAIILNFTAELSCVSWHVSNSDASFRSYLHFDCLLRSRLLDTESRINSVVPLQSVWVGPEISTKLRSLADNSLAVGLIPR